MIDRDTLNIARITDFPDIEALLIKAMYEQVKNTPKDGQWRIFTGTLKIKDKYFELKAEFRMKELTLELGKRTIRKKDGTIIVEI